MAYVSSDRSAHALPIFGALVEKFAASREAYRTYRQKRAIYLRTLSELRSYKAHELHDLRIQSGDFEELARKQAGW